VNADRCAWTHLPAPQAANKFGIVWQSLAAASEVCGLRLKLKRSSSAVATRPADHRSPRSGPVVPPRRWGRERKEQQSYRSWKFPHQPTPKTRHMWRQLSSWEHLCRPVEVERYKTSHSPAAMRPTARGIATARGGAWTPVQVSDILRRVG
jgi:hypothetical protein